MMGKKHIVMMKRIGRMTNIMKRTILFITSLVLITSVSFSQSKVNINNLSDYGGKMFKENDDKPYTGLVFDLYRTTGNKSLVGRYKDGLRNGKWSWWNVENKMDSSGTYKDGNQNRKWTYWYENGEKWKEGTYKDGKKHGLWTEWFENGQKKSEGTYKDGERDGLNTYWYENGQKKIEGTWKDGEKDGFWTYFYENGQKYLEKTYKDGKEISSKCWDKDGNECECGQYWWAGCK